MNTNFSIRLLFLFVFLCGPFSPGYGLDFPEPFLQAPSDTTAIQRTYIITAPINDLTEFRKLVEQVSVLKPFGRVLVNISTLAEKSFYEIPEGRNFWYEYASYNPTPYKFFPDEKIEPYIPQRFVEENRKLILAKAEILRQHNLKAAFWSYEPNFLPPEFFNEYPHLMGPRVDHPRRNNKPAFAPCISMEETRQMNQNMVRKLLTEVPEIETFFFKTNDAGSGICWSDWQYTGPNGPQHCKDQSMGQRVRNLMESFKKGAGEAGKEIEIYLTGSMFSDEEREDIYEYLPQDCYFQSHDSDEVRGRGSGIVGKYPIRGFFQPIKIIEDIGSVIEDDPGTVFISFRASYDRGYENYQSRKQLIDFLVEYLKRDGEVDNDLLLLEYCKKWVGDGLKDRLHNAFRLLEEAEEFRKSEVKGLSNLYWTVSSRHINRPLVFNTLLLTPEEEAYFLPFVFNPSEREAREDYADIHGSRRELNYEGGQEYAKRLDEIAVEMEDIAATAGKVSEMGNWINSIRLQGSLVRSAVHFSEAQQIITRNQDKLTEGPNRPDKVPTWKGDEDLLMFNEIMRRELDNTLSLIALLEAGGMEVIAHADHPYYEDTFLLGPDLIDQLKWKRKIMLDHWTDIERYLKTPLK